VQTSSMGGEVVFPESSLYHAAKWGVERFFETLSTRGRAVWDRGHVGRVRCRTDRFSFGPPWPSPRRWRSTAAARSRTCAGSWRHVGHGWPRPAPARPRDGRVPGNPRSAEQPADRTDRATHRGSQHRQLVDAAREAQQLPTTNIRVPRAIRRIEDGRVCSCQKGQAIHLVTGSNRRPLPRGCSIRQPDVTSTRRQEGIGRV
jgi:hypothetical protein